LAISYPLALPTSIGIADITLSANNAVAISQSPFTFQQQIIRHPGQKWVASVSIPPVHRDLAEPWVSFLLSMNGPAGSFLLGDPNGKAPRGNINQSSTWFLSAGVWNLTGLWQDNLPYSYDPSSEIFANLKVRGDQGTGTSSLDLKGVSPDVSQVFLAGDYIQLGVGATATLHKVLQDVDSDSSGHLTVEVWPYLRREVLDDEPVTFRNATGKFRLSGNSQSFSINDASVYGVQFDCEEAI